MINIQKVRKLFQKFVIMLTNALKLIRIGLNDLTRNNINGRRLLTHIKFASSMLIIMCPTKEKKKFNDYLLKDFKLS